MHSSTNHAYSQVHGEQALQAAAAAAPLPARSALDAAEHWATHVYPRLRQAALQSQGSLQTPLSPEQAARRAALLQQQQQQQQAGSGPLLLDLAQPPSSAAAAGGSMPPPWPPVAAAGAGSPGLLQRSGTGGLASPWRPGAGAAAGACALAFLLSRRATAAALFPPVSDAAA